MRPSPSIIYGTAWKKLDTERYVRQAIGCGFRAIDTARQPKHYHEAGVGDALAAMAERGVPRGEIYLQSKFTSLSGHDPQRIPYDATATLPEQVAQSFQRSLQNLRTDYLDGLLLHSPLDTLQRTLQAWHAMEALVDIGGVRQIGISNCYSPGLLTSLHREARHKPAVLQNRFHAKTGYDRELRQFCRQHAISYQSFWTLTANPQLLADPACQAIAHRHQRTPAQLLFRFLTQVDVVPLTGTTSATHMRDDLAIFEFELDEEECAQFAALLRAEVDGD